MFLAVGTLWWILLTAVVIIGLLWSVDKCHPVFATISFLVYLAILQWFSHVPIFATIMEHPSTTIILIVAYLATGICWSFLRWWLYIRQVFSGKRPFPRVLHSSLESYRQEWLRRRNEEIRLRNARVSAEVRRVARVDGTEAPETLVVTSTTFEGPLKEEWLTHLRTEVKPKATDNKGKISIWIIYWPLSALWSLIEDLIHEVLKWIVTKLRVIYDAIGNSAMKDVA